MKILVVRYRFIGDTILTIPFLRNLREAYPDAQIDMLAGPISKDILGNCPYIYNLIEFDTTSKHRYENKGTKKKSFWDYVKILKASEYDKAYILKRSLSSALLCYFAKIKERIGYDTEHRAFFLTKPVPYIKNRHENECFLDVLRADGIKIGNKDLENWITEESNQKIDEIFEEHNIGKDGTDRKNVLIHATAGNVNKQWALENFAQIIQYLSNKKNVQIFYTGAKADADVYEKIHLLADEELKIKPINLCGELSIPESTALIKRMSLVIGCDSGVLHIASSVNVPVIGIYGPMNPVKWQAWGQNNTILCSDRDCVPCDLRKPCPYNIACLKDITPNIIIKSIRKYINF